MILRLHSLAVLLTVISAASGLQPSDIPPDTPVASLISTAKSYLASGSPRDAIVYFDVAISKDPSNYLTIFQRGAAYLSLGRNAKAAEDFNRVLELKPDFEGALVQRARLKTKSADWTGAKRDLKAAGKQGGPELVELKEAERAAKAAEQAEKRGDWEACVSEAGTAILTASTALSLRQLRARCRFEKGEIQEGVNDLAHVLQISPGSVDPYLQMSAMLFYCLGELDRGIAQIRTCLHSDPDSKACGRLFRREKQTMKLMARVREGFEQRKFVKAVGLLVGSKDESGLIDDVKEDVAYARKEGYIHPKAPDALYATLVEQVCEGYREVSQSFPIAFYYSSHNPNSGASATDEFQAQGGSLLFGSFVPYSDLTAWPPCEG
jgi:DnaJ family protein C protein 3